MFKRIEGKIDLTRDLWIEIDLGAIAHNVSEIKKLVGDTKVCAVVKADGYGHGAVEIGKTLLDAGASMFAVATVDEALEMREHFRDVPILVLGETDAAVAPIVARARIAVTVTSLGKAQKLAGILRASESPRLAIHIKVDTGMGRIGFAPNEASLEDIVKIARISELEIEGLYSHFSSADEANKDYARLQLKRYQEFSEELRHRGIVPRIRHMANSAGIVELPESHFDMVRTGILPLGLYPSPEVDQTKMDLRPALSLKSRVGFVKTVEHPLPIGYGGDYIASPGEHIVTLPFGYADGLPRALSGKMDVLIGGRRCRQVGRISMDLATVRTAEVVEPGAEAVIVGAQGDEYIGVDELARHMGSINYEVICGFSKRIPRLYISHR